jgi:hypothetical protein
VGESNEGVGSVQPHANDIDYGRGFLHRDTVRKIKSCARENERRACLIIIRCRIFQ